MNSQRLFMRGFRFRLSIFFYPRERLSRGFALVAPAREKNPLLPRVTAYFFNCIFVLDVMPDICCALQVYTENYLVTLRLNRLEYFFFCFE